MLFHVDAADQAGRHPAVAFHGTHEKDSWRRLSRAAGPPPPSERAATPNITIELINSNALTRKTGAAPHPDQDAGPLRGRGGQAETFASNSRSLVSLVSRSATIVRTAATAR
ncbi:hypothetical protein GCM10028789_12800 [Sinomonas halotolerans]